MIILEWFLYFICFSSEAPLSLCPSVCMYVHFWSLFHSYFILRHSLRSWLHFSLNKVRKKTIFFNVCPLGARICFLLQFLQNLPKKAPKPKRKNYTILFVFDWGQPNSNLVFLFILASSPEKCVFLRSNQVHENLTELLKI